ncbi:MAG: RNA polymerase sigma-54 factor [Deltaproteobacteria bacterium RBG_13_52_11]|nr:MAG: RNA polymerase sigma-54 factor [Deltaproteobacteria bacterium RBG_13_52_11]
MALEIKQDLKLTQQLVMTPQLQQAIKLLQLSRMELQEIVDQEIKENPVLEEDSSLEEREQEERDKQEVATEAEAREDAPESMKDHDWEEYMEGHSISTYTPPRTDGGETPWENLIACQVTLADYLLWQLRMSPLSYQEQEVGTFIIGNIDDNGYLQGSLEEVCAEPRCPAKRAERVLDLIQSFDPPGVGARDLQECLLIQLRVLPERNPLAEEIVKGFLAYCKKRDYRGLARKLKASLAQILEAVEIISHLDPKPGRPFSLEEARAIIPDVFVYKDEGNYMVVLNDDGLPKLRINSYYREMIDANKDGVPRSYLKEKMKSALWLIRSIQQRQMTLYKVTKSIVKFQRDFLDKGIDYLEPLILREVADDIQMHESTVSRVTTNKYAHTPRGVYELKFFFSGKVGGHGEEVAVKRVQNLIKQAIAEENNRRPYSDEKICQLLKERHNITIARRTVAKYREMMKILSSSERKKMM